MKPLQIAEFIDSQMRSRLIRGYSDVPRMIMYCHNGDQTEWFIINACGFFDPELDLIHSFPRFQTASIRQRLLDKGIISVELK